MSRKPRNGFFLLLWVVSEWTLVTSAGPELLDCTFRDRSLCSWKSVSTPKGDSWAFGAATVPASRLGPLRGPDGINGSYIYMSAPAVRGNNGFLELESIPIPLQKGLVCASFYYHMFDGRGMNLSMSVREQPFVGGEIQTTLFSRIGRSTADRWYLVQRNLIFDHPVAKVIFRVGADQRSTGGTVALGPMHFTSGGCKPISKNPGWCDFAVTLCGWRVQNGWYRHEPDASGFRTRSSHADSDFFMTITNNDIEDHSVLTSPKFNGSSQPQCFEFWYQRERPDSGSLQLELLVNGENEEVIWTQSTFAGGSWMLARVPITEEEDFQVQFRAMLPSLPPADRSSRLTVDDMHLLAGPCKPLVECSFENDLCDYTSSYQYDWFRWFVGTGRLARANISPGLPQTGGSATPRTSAYVDLTDLPYNATEQVLDGLSAWLLSPIFEVRNAGERLLVDYFRAGPDIKSLEISQVTYEASTTKTVEAVQLKNTQGWKTLELPLVPAKHCQIVVTVERAAGANGIAAIRKIAFAR